MFAFKSTFSESMTIRASPAAYKNEMKKWAWLSFLTGIGNFSDMAPWLISLIMIGHVSTQDLAALGIIEVWLYSFLEVIWNGIGLTESVLVSQAHGKKNLVAMRGWAFISAIIMTVGNCVIAVLCVTASPTLKSFGLNPTLVDIGQVYANYIIPAMFIEGFNICAATYLCSLQAPMIPTLIHLFGVVIDIPVSYVFIFGPYEDAKFIRNPLVGSALGWIASAGVVMLLNIGAIVHLWGKELEYGDNEEDDDAAGDIVLRGDNKNKHFISTSEVVVFGEQVNNHNNQQRAESGFRKASLGGGGFGVGFRKNSGINTVMNNLRSQQNDAEDRAQTLTSNGLYDKLLTLNVDDDLMDDKGDVEGASMSSVIQWMSARRRWKIYGKQAFPNCLTVLLQCSVFTVLSFLAANLGEVEIAAHNQNIALLEVAFTFVGGMAEGTSIRVGYHIGRGNIDGAKLVMQIAFAVNLVLGVLVGLIGYYFRYELASLLSSDPRVVEVSVKLAPLLWSTFALFAVADQSLGVLEGQGRAIEQSLSFLVGAVGVTIPLALISYFSTSYGLIGLWYSLFVGFLLSEIIALVLVIFYSDWGKMVKDATNRLSEIDALSPLPYHEDADMLDKIIQIKKTSSKDARNERIAGAVRPSIDLMEE